MVNSPQEWPLLPKPGEAQPRPLPVSVPHVGPVGFSIEDPLKLSANFTDEKRSGRWAVPPFIRAAPNMSNVKLDLRDAVPQADIIHLQIDGVAGNVVLVLPAGWGVDSDRLGKGIGTIRNRFGPLPTPGYPVVVVTGSVGMGTFVARKERFYERWGRQRQDSSPRELLR